ncbi:histidine kinase [Paenibacillus woosongensis]|uniref:histidine kinase n=1 Tax=Paenibacillus woosongensis TaxID=307580 RepID=A0AA95I3M9_9BACL|nr:histidine kinase [Paenibacillus woosongensis]WHX47269.1 histidine kinase [Paenibacillus woosongensis]
MKITYQQIKYLILAIPTITIGIWEFVRHEYLLSVISMELGNWLTPAIVFLVSVLLLTQLFKMMEQIQQELNEAKAHKAALEEREKIAREIHDGIAQSLFLLNAQVSKIEKAQVNDHVTFEKLKNNIHRTNTYVREAIANLRHPAAPDSVSWMQGIDSLIGELKQETDLHIHLCWDIPEEQLTVRDKVELLALIRESLFNIHKHARAKEVHIEGHLTDAGWACSVTDDGVGFDMHGHPGSHSYGIKMMQDRAAMMGWRLEIERNGEQTMVIIQKQPIP